MTTAGIGAKRGRPVETGKLEYVLAVATQQFASRGYRAVTMREVAELAKVSTRTLYNHYADKLSLFEACIDAGAHAFPVLDISAGGDIAKELESFISALITQLSIAANLQIGILVYREGADFPEIQRAAKENQHIYLVKPLARLLRAAGLEEETGYKRAILLLNMATSEWQRRMIFGDPPMNPDEIAEHAALVTGVFLDGAKTAPR